MTHTFAIREPGCWRGFVHVGERVVLRAEITSTWRLGVIATLEVAGGDGDEIGVTAAVPGVFAHAAVGGGLLHRAMHTVFRPGALGYGGRTTGVTVHDGRLRLYLLASENASTTTHRFPRLHRRHRRRRMRPEAWGAAHQALAGHQFTVRVSPMDLIFGERRRLQIEYDLPVPAEVTLPEGGYPCLVTLDRSLVGRPRWPFGRERTFSADVDLDSHPIPVPGKGENAWDCDDDAFSAIGCPARDVGEAVGHAAARVLSARERYGGRAWRPEPAT